MLKIYLERPLPGRERFAVEDEFWVHYLENVRRINRGDPLEVVGEKQVAKTEVVSTSPPGMKVISTRERELPTYSLWLAQAVTRKKKFEDTVRRTSELGVTHLLPLISENTVRRPNNPEKQQKRWKKIALDSTRITGRDWQPKIFPPVDFKNITDHLEDNPKIYWGDPEGKLPGEVFSPAEDNVALVVGPEGGFTAEEKEYLQANEAKPVSLGSRNYRAETAAQVLTTLWLVKSGKLINK
ncbi:MAG: RsmE family RNA methyltransferase [bacterium]